MRNVYTGEVAAGARGVAQGPRGNVAVGARGVVVDPSSGRTITGGRGVVADRETGQVTTVAGASGERGTVARVGNDVYAGKDGNVYRNTGAGWQQRSADGWTAASADRLATGADGRGLDSQRAARQSGELCSQNLARSSLGMQRSFGGGRMGGGRRR